MLSQNWTWVKHARWTAEIHLNNITTNLDRHHPFYQRPETSRSRHSITVSVGLLSFLPQTMGAMPFD
jgi:hypothetical protein